MNDEEALGALSSMANKTRLAIVKVLVRAEPTGMTAGQIAAQIDAKPSLASFHLSNLSEAGLLTSTKEAREITYRVDLIGVGALVRYLLDDCCAGNPTVSSCCD